MLHTLVASLNRSLTSVWISCVTAVCMFELHLGTAGKVDAQVE